MIICSWLNRRVSSSARTSESACFRPCPKMDAFRTLTGGIRFDKSKLGSGADLFSVSLCPSCERGLDYMSQGFFPLMPSFSGCSLARATRAVKPGMEGRVLDTVHCRQSWTFSVSRVGCRTPRRSLRPKKGNARGGMRVSVAKHKQ